MSVAPSGSSSPVLPAPVSPAVWWHPVVAVGAPLLVGSGLLLLNLEPPGESAFPYPPCPWFALTGTFCPGCGSTRAFSALAVGDPLGALRQNLMLLPASLFLVWAWLRLVASLVPGAAARLPSRLASALLAPTRPHPRLILGVLFVVVAWWVLRNVPVLSFLAPLPV